MRTRNKSWSIHRATDRGFHRREALTSCELVAEDGFRLLGKRVVDLSPSGVLVRSDEPADIGESVFISMKLPGGVSFIGAVGEVARIARGRRTSDRGRSLGIRFTEIDGLEQSLLRSALLRLPRLEPVRHHRRDYAGTIADIEQGFIRPETPSVWLGQLLGPSVYSPKPRRAYFQGVHNDPWVGLPGVELIPIDESVGAGGFFD